MTLEELQAHLKATKRYAGRIDGKWGRLTEAGILLALTDGPDTVLNDVDFLNAAASLVVPAAVIKAFWKVEAAGAGFENGKPKILPERHYFSKLTRGRWDKKYPRISYPRYGTLPYPRTQDERYDLLLAMVELDVDAGFASVSYGAPQIMGANWRLCGFTSPFDMAEYMARDEATQLRAFMQFVENTGILRYLRQAGASVESWEEVASRYNGPAWRTNNYAMRMRDAYLLFGGK